MTEPSQNQSIIANNEPSLRNLISAIGRYKGRRFGLILIHCNYKSVQEAILKNLREHYSGAIKELILEPSCQKLLTTIQEQVKAQKPDALMILELGKVEQLDNLLIELNQHRDEFRNNCPFPLIFWLTDEVLIKLINLAPDFHSWAVIPIPFRPAPEALTEFLEKGVNDIFDSILARGNFSFLDNSQINLELDAYSHEDLEAAKRDLQKQGQSLEPELEARLLFAQGREIYLSNKLSRAVAKYKQSLRHWQKVGHSEREGILLFYIGLCYERKAQLKRARKKCYWKMEKIYIQKCCDVFKEAQRNDLLAKFISKFGDVLQKLEQWDELKKVANESIQLHENDHSQVQQAQDYGFLASVALSKSDWETGKQHAQTALGILTQLPEEQRWREGWYLLLLAKGQKHLDQIDEALKSLEEAKVKNQTQDDPQLYIDILKDLEQLQKQRHQYLEALDIKQKRRIIESQHGLRAFIGAVSLQPNDHPNLDSISDIVAPAISTSHRQQDLNRLRERITRNDTRLTIVYGQSGVGKSSIIKAGLVPLLKSKPINKHDLLPLSLSLYTDWTEDIGKSLKQALESNSRIEKNSIPESINSVENILEQLKQNEQRQVTVVLIFDQFEEFFLVRPKAEDREAFFQFLGECLRLNFVYVILSLREDYLHYLLEWERIGTKKSIHKINYAKEETDINDKSHDSYQNYYDFGRDILSLKNRYELKNFSPEDAKAIIKKLTKDSQFYLESALVDELVNDLSKNSGEVRPIELQIVGSQLQAKDIITLKQYQELGEDPKAVLVQCYLEEVVEDCGSENKKASDVVLYLLTGENNTRPLKTRDALERDLKVYLKVETKQVDLVLQIIVKSGLVLLLPEIPTHRYQLVHDYVVGLIRKQQEDNLKKLAEEVERQKKKMLLTEAKLEEVEQLNQELKEEQEERKKVDGTLKDVQQQLETKKEELENTKKQIKDVRLFWGGIVIVVSVILGGLFLTASRDLQETKIENTAGKLEIRIRKLKSGKNGDNLTSLLKESLILGQEAESSHNTNEKIRFLKITSKSETEPFYSSSRFVIKQVVDLLRPQGQKRLMHEGEVRSVSLNPDGTILATASGDNIVRLWDKEGKLLRELIGHKDSVFNVKFSPDGKTLATASTDGFVYLWNTEKEKIETEKKPSIKLNGDSLISTLEFSPDSKNLMIGDNNGAVSLWDLNKKQLTELPGYRSKSVLGIKFSKDGHKIAIGFADGTISLNEFQELKKIEPPLTKHIPNGGSSLGFGFSQDGKEMVSILQKINKNNTTITVQFLDLKGQKLNKDFIFEKKYAATQVALRADLQTLAIALEDGTVDIINLDNGKSIFNGYGYKGRILDLSFSKNGNQLAAASTNGIASWWNLKSASNQNSNTIDDLITLKDKDVLDYKDSFSDIEYNPKENQLATVSNKWKCETNKQCKFQSATVTLWDTGGKKLFPFQVSKTPVYSIQFSPDGKSLVAASQDGSFSLWDIQKKPEKPLRQFQVPNSNSTIWGVSFSPDGKQIATASDDNNAYLWDLKEGRKPLKIFKGHWGQVLSISFSPNGKYLATGSADKTARLWDLNTGKLLHQFDHQNWVLSVNFSPHGNYLATGSGDGIARLWNVPDQDEDNNKDKEPPPVKFEGHQGSVRDVSFNTEGTFLATASEDKTIRLWDLQGHPIAEFNDHKNGVRSVKFIGKDENWLASASEVASEEGTAVIRRIKPLDELLKNGCSYLKNYLDVYKKEMQKELPICYRKTKN